MEERFELYYRLIQQLLACPEGEELELLQDKLDLIDLGLLVFMQQVADNNSNTAKFLRSLAQWLVQQMGFNSVNEMHQQYHNCLMEILRTVNRNPTREIVYPLLQKHLEKLNFNLGFVLYDLAQRTLSVVELEQAQAITTTIFNFGNLIFQFPNVNKANNLELAITAHKSALIISTQKAFSVNWAMTQNSLGSAYNERIKGNRAENLETAIACYQNALTIFTQQDFPVDWAMTQNNLSNVYLERIKGNRAENLETAIASCEDALIIRTQQDFPVQWAMTQNNLGNAYLERIKGNRADNLEIAIACYQNALIIRTQQDFPVDWAMTQYSLGNAYNERIKGNRAENLETAISSCRNALRIYTQQDFPVDWAMTQNNLGNAYRQRIKGDWAENLETAIFFCEDALTIFTQQDSPVDWAKTQNNLGDAYLEKIKGDRAENLETAIACYQNALTIFTQQDSPVDWAKTQNNLGNAYRNRIEGDQVENLETAIACYQNALTIFTQQDFPVDWAIIQYLFGATYRERNEGDRAENLETAIASCEDALTILTQQDFPASWAMTQDNLGNAYRERIEGDRAENLEIAIACYQNALIIYTQQDLPVDWAIIQHNLGNAYRERIEGDRAENLEIAIACYQNALIIRTQQDFPVDCLQTASHIGSLHFDQSNWQLAIQGFQKAIAAIEITRNWATKDLRRQKIVADSMAIYENTIQACINNGQLELAIETTERSRARHLVDLMASHYLYQGGDIPEEIQEPLEQYEHLQEKINLLRLRFLSQASDNRTLATSGTRWRNSEVLSAEKTEEIKELEAEKQQIWEQLRRLDPILAGQQQVNPIKFDEIEQLIDNNSTAILSFYSTSQDTYIFILYRDLAPQIHTCKEQNRGTLHKKYLANNWLLPYAQYSAKYSDKWRENIPTVLEELAQRLQLEQLIKQHLQGIEELIIIPHLWLHQIPFAALPVNSIPPTSQKKKTSEANSRTQSSPPERETDSSRMEGGGGGAKKNKRSIPENRQDQYLGDLFRLRILPSCQILNYCHQRPDLPQQNTMGLVENASEDLPYTTYECETLASKYPSKRLQGHQATVNECRRLASQVSILHLSHHGKANLNPLESALKLSDARLTLGELLTPGWRKDLQHLRDVYLNNCETNFNINKVTDDLLSIATGFLCAGARSVVSTLWSVDDCASALLAIFYYEFRHSGSSRPQALQQAQKKLRTLTGKQLQDDYLEQLNSHLQQQYQQALANSEATQNREQSEKYQDIADKIRQQIDRTLPEHCKSSNPFASPFYWAGFISQGLA